MYNVIRVNRYSLLQVKPCQRCVKRGIAHLCTIDNITVSVSPIHSTGSSVGSLYDTLERDCNIVSPVQSAVPQNNELSRLVKQFMKTAEMPNESSARIGIFDYIYTHISIPNRNKAVADINSFYTPFKTILSTMSNEDKLAVEEEIEAILIVNPKLF